MTQGSSRSTELGTRSPETSLTLSKGLQVLELLARTPDGRTVAEICDELTLSRPTLYRLVTTLIEHGLVLRSPDGTYRVALGLLALVRNVVPALGEMSEEILQRLAEGAGASAHFAIAEGDQSVAVAVAEPRLAEYRIGYRVGTRLPLDRGALGKAILAGRSGPPRVLSSTGEVIPGATGAAVAVVGLGSPAAVGIVALRPLDMEVVKPLLVSAADELRAVMTASAPTIG
ncbi:IclR family transcriptional regulator [Oryzobacter telluris]|uniref:IclR family transcriptional regulator n=1 Tax=Oryzobacter telluris TaxID=3149179 RepID=UPI00370D2ABC